MGAVHLPLCLAGHCESGWRGKAIPLTHTCQLPAEATEGLEATVSWSEREKPHDKSHLTSSQHCIGAGPCASQMHGGEMEVLTWAAEQDPEVHQR